jgi:hypothetical protein
MSDKIGAYAVKVKKTVVSTVKKIFAGIFGFLAFAFTGFAALFFLVKIPYVGTLIGVGVFFICLAVAMVILTAAMLRSGGSISKVHSADIAECEKLLKKIKFQIDNQKLKNEFSDIFATLSKELVNAKKIAFKINSIQKTLRLPEWDLNEVTIKINSETKKANANQTLLQKLNEQKENILKLKNRQTELTDQITMLKANFNSIYTKITLLDTTDKVGFDEIETEIHKILDFKLKVSNFEDELDRELK